MSSRLKRPRSLFDDAGRFAFRTRKAKAASGQKHSASQLFLCHTLRLAALFHDLGKCSVAFQEKLQGTLCAEPIRHELLSMLIVYQALIEQFFGLTKDPSDEAWLAHLATNPAAIAQGVCPQFILSAKTLERTKALVAGTEEEPFFLGSILERLPLLGGLLWLIVTHHRLIGHPNELDNKSAEVTFRGFHARPDDKAMLQKNLTLACGTPPWEDPKWQRSVARCARALLELLKTHPQLKRQMLRGPKGSFNRWPLLLTHVLRPLLGYADRTGSILKSTPARGLSEAFDGAHIYANTRQQPNGKPALSGDLLSTHLLAVRRWSHTYCELLTRQETLFPRASFPQSSAVFTRSPESPFSWQDEAADFLRKASRGRPAFISVISETGSGKTLGSAKILEAISASGRVRYTQAIGRRSLTSQTGDTLRESAGLSSQDCAVIIGEAVQELVRKLTAYERSGTESAAPIEPFNGTEDSALQGEWVHQLQDTATAAQVLGGQKAARMLDVPVLCCTVDHLIPAVQAVASIETAATLRLLTADLVLDEIDDYASRDLVALGKLALMTGIAGKHLIIMSATIPALVVSALHEAWCEGISLHREWFDTTVEPGAYVVSNLVEPAALPCDLLAESPSNRFERPFETLYTQYVNRFAEAIGKAPVRRRAAILPLPAGSTREECFEHIFQGARQIHTLQAAVDPQSGKRLSVGIIRLRTATDVFDFGRYALSRPSDTDVVDWRVLCYHAKMPLLTRTVIEQGLSGLLNRKHPEALFAHPAVRNALDSSSKADLGILIIATSIIETGRDIDSDWAISEPTSARAISQLAGRLRRHRPQAYAQPNLFVLERSLRAATGQNEPFGYPGIEDPRTGLRVTRGPMTPSVQRILDELAIPARTSGTQRLTLAQEALPMAQWRDALDSREALLTPQTYESNRIGTLELVDLYQRLLVKAPNKATLTTYLGHGDHGHHQGLPWCLYSWHVDKTRFRSSDGARETELFFKPTVDWMTPHYLEEGTGPERPAKRISSVYVPHKERALLDVESLIQEQYASIMASGAFSEDAYRLLLKTRLSYWQNETDVRTLKGEYSPLLGFSLR